MHKPTCIFEGCERSIKSRDWCHKHYEHLRSRGELPPKPCKGCGGPCPGAGHYCSDGCKPRCAVGGCVEQAVSRSWCMFHYTRWKLTGDPAAALERMQYEDGQSCSFKDCENKARKSGLCSGHYLQSREGKSLKPLAYKSKGYTCAFCGGPSGKLRGFRKYCSAKCQRLFYRHGEPLPDEWSCTLCGKSYPYIIEGRRRVKHGTRMCDACRLASAKHGYSPAQLAQRDGLDCGLCGNPVDLSLKHPDLMRGSVDHILPTSLGGSNEPENVQLAHLHCNIKKNNRVEVSSMG